MKERLIWAQSSYKIIRDDKVVLERYNTACFSEFMSRFNSPYDTIRLYDIDCKPTIQYKDFFLQYVIDMFKIEGSFNDEYFEFKSTGIKKKDAAVMSVVRLLWEQAGNQNIDTPNKLFKPLFERHPCRWRDKLKRFCFFYKKLEEEVGAKYFSCGHSWMPKYTRIRSTKEFVTETKWINVNNFFTDPELEKQGIR